MSTEPSTTSATWTVSVVRGDDLRNMIAAEIGRAEVLNCLAFIREYASADLIGEEEFYRLIGQFCGDEG